MSTEQLNRFNLLIDKVTNASASLNELKEFKELLASLNDVVAVKPLQSVINLKKMKLTPKQVKSIN